MKKIIRDAIYTYIEIEEKVKDIIDTESFQRLRYIRQLTIQHLYPCANHTRFEHSLGVMHLALLVFERIKEKLITIQKAISSEKAADAKSVEIDYLKDHLLYASLLHDVGHAPLSHVGEKFFRRKNILSKIRSEMETHKDKPAFSVGFLEDEEIPPHELMSCYVIIRKFHEQLKPCYYSTAEDNVAFDLEFIFRIICGKVYDKDDVMDSAERAVKNIIISIVNSKTIDVDKIDYLLRDNKMVGFIGPQLDRNRLLMSVDVDESGGLTFGSIGISALQGLIDCRDSLYLWVFNHHTVVYTDYLYQKCFINFCKLINPAGKKILSLGSLFSCKAIADNCVSDVDALSAINRISKSVKSRAISSEYTYRLVNQLVDRKFLKPIWKTLHQYNDFLADCGYSKNDKKKREELTGYINEYENRKRLVLDIAKDLGIEHGNLFIVERENNFYENKLDGLTVIINNKKVSIAEILPIKKSEEIFDKTAFYVYCEENKKELVKKRLKEKVKEIRGRDPQAELVFEF